jgi:hypothetical protein
LCDEATSLGPWAVAVRRQNVHGDVSAGFSVLRFEQPSEAAARKAFADRVRQAPVMGYKSVALQLGDVVIDDWPTSS